MRWSSLSRQQPTTDGPRCRYRCPRQHHLPGSRQLQAAYPGTGSCAIRATLVPPILGGATAARHLISCGAPLCGTAGIGSLRARLRSHEARHEDTSHGAPHAHPGTLPELVLAWARSLDVCLSPGYTCLDRLPYATVHVSRHVRVLNASRHASSGGRKGISVRHQAGHEG